MVFNVINNQFGLFAFLKRYGGAIQQLIEDIRGFTTLTIGATNVVNFGYKWKNVRGQVYKTEDFEVQFNPVPINIISQKSVIKNFNLSVIKQMIPVNIPQKLRIIRKFIVKSVNPLTINKGFESDIVTPLNVLPWMKRNTSTKQGGLIWTEPKDDDVGTISDIELLNIIKEIEVVNAIG